MTYKIVNNPSLIPNSGDKPSFNVTPQGELEICFGDFMFTLTKQEGLQVASFIDRQLGGSRSMFVDWPTSKTDSPARCYATEA
jgi:hypothetical protein